MTSISDELAAWRSSVATIAPKTAEQIRAEYAAMNFEQLRTRAGPPPTVAGCDYHDIGAGEGRSDGAEKYNFDSSLSLFKQGRGPPPAPLIDNNRPEARAIGVTAYQKWWSAWGNKLSTQWYKEHPRAVGSPYYKKPSTPPKPVVLNNTVSAPKRPEVEIVTEKSGW
jgi:hypothetical protein